jgi:hypothetical protein
MKKPNADFGFLLYAFVMSSIVIFLFSLEVTADASHQSGNGTGGAFKRTAFFEKNIGQTNSDVLYLYPSVGYRLMLFSNEAVIAIRMPRSNQSRIDDPASFKKINRQKESKKETRIKMQFLGANKSPRIDGKGELTGKSHYFIGKNQEAWLRNVLHYDNVLYEDIYPDVDLIFYSNENKLEYDFIVNPKADPGNIRFTFGGIDRMSIDSAGDLILFFGEEELRLHRPKLHQLIGGHKVNVIGDYIIHDDIVGFQVAAYDHSVPLVIDPVLSYSTFIGDAGYDEGEDIVVDADKNAYVVGATDALNIFGTSDILVLKFDSSGQLIFSLVMGGASEDTGNGIAVDSSGNIYLTGTTGSDDFPTTPGVIQTSKVSGSADAAFAAKINSAGSEIVYSTFLSGGPQTWDGSRNGFPVAASYTNSFGIAVDPSGNAYIAGYTQSPTFPVTPAALQTTYGGAGDAFVAKLNSDASQLIYSTYLGGSGIDEAYAITSDADGNVYVAGQTNSVGTYSDNDFPLMNAYQSTQKGVSDGFVAKLNPTGSALVFSTFLGGSSSLDGIYGLAIDNQRNIYVTGQTKSPNWPGAQNPDFSITTFGDGFVTKLSPTGDSIIYSLYLGGRSFDYGTDIAVDITGNAYVIGVTLSPDFPVTEDAYQEIKPGNDDFFITKIDSNGVIVYSTFLGGFYNDAGRGIAVASPTEIYVTGYATSSEFPTANAVQSQKGGYFDAIIAKIDLAAPIYKLSVVKNGDDNLNIFTIRSDPPGIVCGEYCTASNPYSLIGGRCNDGCTHYFDAGAQVKFLVDPDLKYFIGWNYTLSGTENGMVTIDQERNVSVTFIRSYGLNINISGTGKVTSDPAGIDCTGNCSNAYTSETKVTLTATPDVNSTFAGWSGEGCSGTGPCIVTMNQTRNVYATFTQLYKLNIIISGKGKVVITQLNEQNRICKDTCTIDYSVNYKLTLKVKPVKGHQFIGWSGACKGNKSTCTVTMNQAKSVKAKFR